MSPKLVYSAGGDLPKTGIPSAGSSYYFYDTLDSIPKSPSAGTQTGTSTLPANLSRTLALPATRTGNWYFADGDFYKRGSPETYENSYLNGEVVETLLSEDLTHRLASWATTQVTVTPLTGPIVSDTGKATGLFPQALYTNQELTVPGVVWGSGSAYSTITIRYNTDVYLVNSPSSPLESSTTIANVIANNRLKYEAKTYGVNDGTVSVVRSVKVYVAKDPRYAATTGSVASYVTFYELNGNVYSGTMEKAGSVQTNSRHYNAQARASIQAALTF